MGGSLEIIQKPTIKGVKQAIGKIEANLPNYFGDES